MIRHNKLLAGVVCACVVLFAGHATGQEEDRISIDLADLDVAEAMQLLSDATGFNILVSNKVTGKITAYVVDMSPERALKEIVEVNGYRYVRSEDVGWVLSDEEYFEDFNFGRVRRVIVLRHARVDSVLPALQGALSLNAKIVAYPDTNVIVLAELEDRMEDAMQLVEELDAAPATRVFQLEHGTASDVLALVQPHVARPETLRADVRTNQVVISGTEESIAGVAKLIKEFDKPDMVSTRVFPLKYANADATAELLREVLTGRRQSASGGVFGMQSGTNQPPPKVFTTEPGQRPSSATPQASWDKYRPKPSASARPASPQQAVAPVASDVAAAPGTEETLALGPLASVAADLRTNSVIITHVESVLERLAQIIESVDVPGQFHTYQFMNLNPVELELETKLMGLLPVERAYLQVDPISRKVTFRAPAEKARELVALLEEWDVLVPQVRIEAEILRVDARLMKELGIHWQAIFDESASAGDLTKVNAEVVFPAAVGQQASQGHLTVGNIDDDDYTAAFQAIAEDNDTEVIASPRILVRDNQEAMFYSVRDLPYSVITVDGNTQTTLEDIRFLNVGVTLIVAPRIHRDGVITLDTQLEISNQVDTSPDGTPVVDRATAQSSVSVRDGGTVVLGGLRQRSRSTRVRGLPVLSKIPLLGIAFRDKRKDRVEFEIVLILRPFIVGDSQDDVPTIPYVKGVVGAAIREKTLSHQTKEGPTEASQGKQE